MESPWDKAAMNGTTDDDEYHSSLERARADMEIIQSCYPDEIHSSSSLDETSSFPFQFTLRLPGETESSLVLQLEAGYPVASGVRIANYRTNHWKDKARLEAVVRAVRQVSSECQQDEIEGCIACCAIALDTWNDLASVEQKDDPTESIEASTSTIDHAQNDTVGASKSPKNYEWISGEPLFDRKSSFQAHICEVHSEQEVKEALYQLLTSSSKIQRATHNMHAWRIAEPSCDDAGRVVIKHDNDDDGEDAAGSKMAFLLDMRKDENVLVVVSRWYGGIHLGPKRFAHIVNVARELLVEYTERRKLKR